MRAVLSCESDFRRSCSRHVHSSAALYAKSRPPWSKDPPPQRELTYKPGDGAELPFHINRIELSQQLPVYRGEAVGILISFSFWTWTAPMHFVYNNNNASPITLSHPTDYRNGNTRIVTILRKFEGNEKVVKYIAMVGATNFCGWE